MNPRRQALLNKLFRVGDYGVYWIERKGDVAFEEWGWRFGRIVVLLPETPLIVCKYILGSNDLMEDDQSADDRFVANAKRGTL
jgi:hypothetical protein